jgi:pilus assembly protein CpaE
VAGETILFIDDEEPIRQLVSTFLRRRGYQVQVAKDGAEGLRMIRAQPPHMVITDVNMPLLSGIELTRWLRANRKTAQIPIIMLSAKADAQDILAGYAEGADEYAPKPIEMAVLAAKVETLLRRAGAVPEAAAATRRGHVVAFVHSKGGVGNSTLAVNAAVALSSVQTYRTMVIDLNLEFGTAAILLDLRPTRGLDDLADVSVAELDDETFRQFVVEHASGARLVAGSSAPERAELVTISTIQHTLERLRHEADYTLVDLPPSFAETHLAALDAADAICLVTAPHVAALKGTADFIDVLRKLEVPREQVLLVLNRHTPTGAANEQVAKFLGWQPDLVVPYNALFDEAANSGRPMVTLYPADASATRMRELASKIAALVPVQL